MTSPKRCCDPIDSHRRWIESRASLSKGATISVLLPIAASKKNILRMRAVGTSWVRRLLQRSAYSRSYRLQMSSGYSGHLDR
jgi:hypothetical protein